MSTTVTGVRIVDMPDLGAVNDTSSVVGERAGSGRFAALALRSYIFGGAINMPSLPNAQPDGTPPVGAVKGDLYNNGGFVCVTP